MQADHQDARGIGVEVQAGVLGTEQIDEFVVNEFDDLLSGLDALDDFRAEGLGFDALNEIAGHLEIHVCFQQGHADFAQGVGNIALRNLPHAPQIAKGILELGR